MSKTKEFKPPTHATTPRVTLADLDTTITLGQLIDALGDVAESVSNNVILTVAHWTDKDGLHNQPFEKDLRKGMEEELMNALKEAGVIS